MFNDRYLVETYGRWSKDNLLKDITMQVKAIKWIGLLGAILSGVTQIMNGDPVVGGGVIAAALSSAGILKIGE